MSSCSPPHCQYSNKLLGTLWERLKQVMNSPAHGANLNALSPAPPLSMDPFRVTPFVHQVLSVRSWTSGTLTWWGIWAAFSGCSWNCPGTCITAGGWAATPHMKAQALSPSLYSNMFSGLKSAWVHHCHLCDKERHLVSLLLSPPVKWV